MNLIEADPVSLSDHAEERWIQTEKDRLILLKKEKEKQVDRLLKEIKDIEESLKFY